MDFALPQPTFSVTAKSVREGTKNRQGKLLTGTVRDGPSGMNWQGKSTFPDGKPSRNGSWRLLPSGESFPVDFFVSVRREFSRWLPYRQERFKLTLSVTVPSGKVETYPAGHLPSGKDQTFCQPTTIREITILISIKAHSTIQIID